MFTLTINTDNSAFTGNPAAEVARILNDVAHYLTAGHGGVGVGAEDGKVRDYNGNTVGRWELASDLLEWECPRCHTINAEEDTEPGDMTCVDCSNTFSADEVISA